MKYISIWRRIASLLYDIVLIVALVIIMYMPLLSFNIEENFILKITAQIYVYLIIQYFFVWFWVNSNGTLGMKSWRVKISDTNGNKITYKKAILRFNVSLIYFLIIGFLVFTYYKYSEMNYFLLMLLAILLSFPLIRKDKKFLHDIISKTILIKI
tara:strand:+ start:3898 stop:4362 length:465 start_codon:yes stop_codon:yes gene_type:complete